MSSSNDNDEQQRFALGFLFALIALVVSTVVGVVVYKRAIQPARAPAPAVAVVAAPEAAILPLADAARIKIENGVVKFYFATGKSEVAAGANEALADVAKGVSAGKKALVSGYHDTTGDLAINEELAKQRAISVRVVLITLGVPEDKVELKKPEAMTGSGDNAEARRVEVLLIDGSARTHGPKPGLSGLFCFQARHSRLRWRV